MYGTLFAAYRSYVVANLCQQRETEHRENLATTIRTLRTEDSQKMLEIEKLKTKTSELTRSLALAEAQERALKTNLSSADATIKALKEQIQRMKATVQQVRAQCANDIRKRDLEMQKLKSHLAERQRGKRDGLSITTININPAVDRTSKSRSLAGGEGINEPGYSLKQETNEFLTELCQTLSDENDALIALARTTVQTLKDLQGLSHLEEEDEQYTNGTASTRTMKSSHGPVSTLPASCEELSGQMERVLEHLRTLLTNPSFVPLEEVEVRDDEIKRLREGWEKMETRWKQAVTLTDGWHKRIADGGDSVRPEELRLGLKLDLSVDSMQTSAAGVADSSMHSPIFEDQQAEEEEEAAAKMAKYNIEREGSGDHSTSKLSSPRERKYRKASSRALKERSDNIMSGRSPRKVSFTPGLQGSPCVTTGEEDETLQVKAHKSGAVTRRPSKKKTDSKVPRQNTESAVQLSVSQKLAAAESEARAAEESRKEAESRKRTRAVKSPKKGNRRRSTLTSDELGELMGMPSR
ncbi:uncharacterized protein ACLA_065530 [Aspergillus clavatus NRRL 1]|uniref:NIMA interactive protein n=1 Tax=Aspergillus clavatus (strain ATCC 1007 / CBS 513.65 / DSM 816 / NCTC 3887 / NRRL 1 / QM 1276 / 107) TaxID=344612 RepID=A1CG39_ASPCL|nr:uncharacterized protein ACLA_065530 [Aspergillus clavatus NRRL 1]EAW10919.1 conserved hypothetical protein [Aspergillus clavatus NRRL 1]